MPAAPPPPTQDQTIEALLDATKRSRVPIRTTFVQQRLDSNRYVGGPLSELVKAQDHNALEQYLLLHAKASGGDYKVTLEAAVWARVMGRSANPTGLTAISKAWKRLEKHGLIRRSRRGRRAQVELLCEDGNGGTYTRPTTKDDPWFHLPHEYWLDHWHQKLDLPGKAVLLIALSLKDDFVLPFPRADAWYSLSRNTLQRGMSELVKHGLIEADEEWVEEPLSAIGHRQVTHYTLQPPFGPHAVRKERAAATAKAVAKAAATAARTARPAKDSGAKKAPVRPTKRRPK
jgi:hypothetical protein